MPEEWKDECAQMEAEDVTGKIAIKGDMVGIPRLGEVLKEVHSLGLGDDEGIAKEILVRVRKGSYIPSGLEAEYRNSLLAEYRKRYPE